MNPRKREAGGREREMEMEDDRDRAEGWRGGAGSVLNLTASSSIPIRYHPHFGSHDDLLLLEVDDKLLPDILHHRVTIRGQPDEDAVLCTLSATYAMKFVGNSNTVFLIPPGAPTSSSSEVSCDDSETNNLVVCEAAASVIKVARGHIELIQAAPRLEKLKTLLNQRPYRLEEDLKNNFCGQIDLYRWQDLIDQVQASEEELMSALRSLSALEINGYWRIVHEKSMDQVLNMILNNSILHEWPLNALQEEDVLSVLEADGFSHNIVLHCLDVYGIKVDNSECALWSLDEKRVCVHFALRALSGGKMKLESFMEKWAQSVPSGMHPDLKMLDGKVLYEKLGVECWIRAFSVSALPSNPAERFAALFRERSKWEWKDLEPYIRDLHVPGLSSEGLLIKYTRRTQPSADVEPIFSAR